MYLSINLSKQFINYIIKYEKLRLYFSYIYYLLKCPVLPGEKQNFEFCKKLDFWKKIYFFSLCYPPLGCHGFPKKNQPMYIYIYKIRVYLLHTNIFTTPFSSFIPFSYPQSFPPSYQSPISNPYSPSLPQPYADKPLVCLAKPIFGQNFQYFCQIVL